MALPTGLGWIDVLVLLVALLSVLLGVLRGLVQEVMSVLGWLAAWLAAQAWAAPLGAQFTGPPMVRQAAGFALVFVFVLLSWRVLTWLLSRILKATPLAPVDRLLGAGFGLLRALLIVVVLVTLGDFTPVARQPFWGGARSVVWVRGVSRGLAPLLPSTWTTAPRSVLPR
jgi:membrane protein required for colicin V production